MAKNQRVQIVSPKGTAVYPWLNRPDTKFSDDGEYKVTLKISAEEAQPLIQKLDKMLEDYQAEQASMMQRLDALQQTHLTMRKSMITATSQAITYSSLNKRQKFIPKMVALST